MPVLPASRVLEVARDFEMHGGVSLELLAWELCVTVVEVAAAWDEAVGHGWIEPSDSASVLHEDEEREGPEELWRLSAAGWQRIGIDPAADRGRGEVVARLGELEAELAPGFDSIVRVAASLLGTAGSALHVFDERFQNRLAAVSVPLGEGLAPTSFCRMVVDAGVPVETADATRDKRFAQVTIARDGRPTRFFAATPLRAGGGRTVVGSLCVFDSEPRQISPDDRLKLEDLADFAEAQIALAEVRSQLRQILEERQHRPPTDRRPPLHEVVDGR